jgi:hypothetical protein
MIAISITAMGLIGIMAKEEILKNKKVSSNKNGVEKKAKVTDEIVALPSRFFDQYFGIGYFVSSFVFFTLGLLIKIIMDSINNLFEDNLNYEFSEGLILCILLLIGIILLVAGVNSVVKGSIGRKIRFFKKPCNFLLCMLDIVLPAQKDNKQDNSGKQNEIKNGANDTSKQILLKRNVIEQITTSFAFLLLMLFLLKRSYTKEIQIEPYRAELWIYILITVLAAIALICILSRKEGMSKVSKYIIFIASILSIWARYWLSGITIPWSVNLIFAIFSLLWFLTMIVYMNTYNKTRYNKFNSCVNAMSFVFPVLSMLVLIFSMYRYGRNIIYRMVVFCIIDNWNNIFHYIILF